MNIKNNLYLYVFIIFLILLYFQVPFLNFIFLIPILIYLQKEKEVDWIKLSIIIFITSLIIYFPFYGYGFKFLIIAGFANILFFIPFFYFSKRLINRKYIYLSIPSLFFIEFYVLHFTIINNFWINLSLVSYIYPKIIQYFGSFLLTFLIIIVNVLSYSFIRALFLENKKTIPKTTIISLIFLLTILHIPIEPITESENNIKVVGIQGNIDQSPNERIINKDTNLRTYLELSEKSINIYDPELIVWPEYVFTHPIELDYKLLYNLSSFSSHNNVTLILGSIFLENKTHSDKKYNSLYIFQKKNITIYNAYEPVKIFDIQTLKAKSNPTININNKTAGLAVCYEENFPYIFNKQINKNENKFFLVIGNQYYIRNNQGLELSSLSSNTRAAETNKYIFRLETAGLSTVIDNTGKNVKNLKIHTQDILYYEIPLIEKKTFYTKYYKYIEVFLFILSIIILSLVLIKRK